jgi:hypothetical protein
MRYAKNTAVVLLVTGVTAAVLYGGVQLLSNSVNASAIAASVVPAGQSYVCPSTGCQANNCHATGSGEGGAAATAPSGDRALASNSGTATIESGVQACPATGCTASTCHGATHSPPPSAGGSAGAFSRGDRALASNSGSASGSSGTLTCPRTGCSASSCHATEGGGSGEGGRRPGGRHGGSGGEPGGGYGGHSH